MKVARVIGAGLSGLATAWHLADHGYTVTVFDSASRPGGLIHTWQTEHGPVETAANAFVWNDTVADWFRRLDLIPAFARPESARRYIFRAGRPRRWPLSVGESATLVRRLAVTAATRAFAARDGESAADWGDRVIGTPGRRWLLDAALQGVYASPTSSLSARAIFGHRRSGRRRMAAPLEGMGGFVKRLHQRLEERGVRFAFDTRVESLEDQTPTAICTGAADASRLLEPHAPELSAGIGGLRLTALATVTMFFDRDPRDLHGFGVLFPQPAGAHALGVLFNTDIFDGRGSLRSETWIVGDREGAVTAWREADLQRSILDDRKRLTGRDSTPLLVRDTRWPQAIPVYDEGILRVMAATPSAPSWIALAGNYLGRLGVAHLLEVAESAANRLTSQAARS
jgi:protoporphyrinogen/coproporphyrinogen III oxidase